MRGKLLRPRLTEKQLPEIVLVNNRPFLRNAVKSTTVIGGYA